MKQPTKHQNTQFELSLKFDQQTKCQHRPAVKWPAEEICGPTSVAYEQLKFRVRLK